jgi:hypothetical protein
MENSMKWFSAVPLVALVMLFIGWNISGSSGSGSRSFSSEEIDLTFDYPSNMIMSPSPGALASFVEFNKPYQKITVTKFRKSFLGLSPAQNAINQNLYEQYNSKNEEMREISGKEALLIDFEYMSVDETGQNSSMRGREMVVNMGDYVVVITYTSTAEKFSEGVSAFERIISSIVTQ